ncbi:hypothetical protein Tco_1355610 [Tanacetum coccineum]
MQAWDKFFEIKHAQSEEVQELLSKLLQDLKSINEELAEYINTPSCNLPTSSYDDDDDEEKDEHLDTIPATELDEVIKFAGELAFLTPIPPGIVEANLDPKEDIRFIENLMYGNSFPRPPKTLKDDSETVIDSNNDYSSSDDDSYKDIDYVDALPPDSELASLEVVEIVIPEVGGIDTDILLTIKDDILHEKLLNVNLLIAKIEALKDNHTPSSDFVTNDFYHEEFAGELAHIISPSKYDDFYFKIEPELGNFTMDVVEDIFDNPTREPRVHVLPTQPTLHLDSDFTISRDSLGSDLVVSFPSRTRNNIFDPGILIRVQSKIFLSWDAFSISFIHDPIFPVIDTLLPFSSENENKVVNTELSHRESKAFKVIIIFESPMEIFPCSYGEDIRVLDVPCLHFYPPIAPDYEASRARVFVLRSLELQSLA